MIERDPEVVVGDDAVLRARLRTLLAEGGRQAVAEGRRWSMAIPGGSVVTRLLTALGPADAPWDSGDLFWVDERVVPHTDPESNFGASRRGWLHGVEGTGLRVHPVPVALGTLDACASAYEATLRGVLPPSLCLDLVVLGVGEDGHVASLFPGDREALASPGLVIAVERAPKFPPRRISLTLPLLARARRVVVAAFGAAKRPVMHAALHDRHSDLPIIRLLQSAAAPVLLMDVAAAGGR